MDEKMTLLSVRDENTILITARFYISRKENKVGESIAEYYDIELIVKTDITCDQLLTAIGEGLKKHYNQLDDSADEKAIYRKCVEVYDTCYEAYSTPRYYEEFVRTALVLDRKKAKRRPVKRIKATHRKVVMPKPLWMIKKKLRESPKILIDCVDKATYKKYPPIKSEGRSISDEDQRWLVKEYDGDKILSAGRLHSEEDESTRKHLGFLTTTRVIFTVDEVGIKADSRDEQILLFDTKGMREGFKKTLPLYNISDRPLYKLNQDAVNIIPPTDPPTKGKTNILRTLIAPVITTLSMVLIVFFGGSGSSGMSMILRYVVMAVITLAMTAWGLKDQKDAFQDSVNEWKDHYQKYIARILADILSKQEQDIAQLKKMYPSMLGVEWEAAKERNNVRGRTEKRIRELTAKNKRQAEQSLVHMCEEIHPDIFSRGINHPDFLSVRLGLSGEDSQLVPSVFPIIGEKKESVFTAVRYRNIDAKNQKDCPFEIIMPNDKNADEEKNDYLINLPSKLAETYGYLRKAPVLLNVKECGTLGVVFPQTISFLPFLDNLILNLCFYHSPDDLQIVLFGAGKKNAHQDLEYLYGTEEISNEWRYRQTIIEKYKYLPHFRELLGDISAFAFCQNDASLIFNRLLEILTERKNSKDEVKTPHILLIFQEEYDFKKHPVSEYLPEYSSSGEKKDAGISFVFCKRFEEELPKYCGKVIHGVQNGDKCKWYLMPHEQQILRTETGSKKNKLETTNRLYEFLPDEWDLPISDLDIKEERLASIRGYKTLSALHYYRIAQGAGVPEYVSLFELMDKLDLSTVSNETEADEKLREYIKKQRESSSLDVTKSLSVPIGKKEGGELVMLDLHEKYDGPHMLVAGTTGSGKTESILTYLVMLCLLYTPEQVNLLLVDMKGAGFVDRLKDLPHVVGTVTDVDGSETGTGTSYMLKRFLQSMKAEVRRRKKWLRDMQVDSVDGYIRAKSNLDDHVKNKKMTEKKDKLEKLPQLAHLFVVIDEYSELMRFTAENSEVDFKAEITSLARIGRSLGFHIILISQNIENAITPDIKANISARLCMKVATREASKEMIGTDLAASPLMPGKGRAYLLVGTGSRFEYFQSGYSGASVIQDPNRPYTVTRVEMGGRYTMFFDSKEMTQEQSNQNQNPQIDEMTKVLKDAERITPEMVFQPLLPNKCYFTFDWNKKKERRLDSQ